jgi:hypothetical protein
MIFVCGDTHMFLDTEKLESYMWEEGQTLTKDDYLIVLGDFGLIWYSKGDPEEKELTEWYNQYPWTTLFIDGNHENFDRLFSDEFKEIEMFGNKVKQISDSIFHLQRGRIYTIQNKTFFTFGGGESIDRNARTPHISWWPQEIPNYYEIDNGIEHLNQYNRKVDFILTHTCSNESFAKINERFDFSYKENSEKSLRDFFFWIEKRVSFNQWHFGHFHDDFKLDNQHFLHYNNLPVRII